MEGFEGALQSDAHSGYGALPTENFLRLGCMMHSRRRFEEAYVVGKKRPGLAADGLAMLRWVYDREEEYKNWGSPLACAKIYGMKNSNLRWN